MTFLEFHRNEKLRKTHLLPASIGGLPLPAGFDPNAFPYVRDSSNGGNLAALKRAGSTVLVVPKPGKSLVRTVSQHNSVKNKTQTVHFIVPRAAGRNRITSSTLMIERSGRDRLAPEYVNIRHRIDPDAPASQTPEDLNTSLSTAAFRKTLEDGGYAAAHFVDDSCDGCVEAVVGGLNTPRESEAAFSLITAPDFLPLADQTEVEKDPSIRLANPLSKGRLPANPSLPLPSDGGALAFRQREKTLTAIVGSRAFGPAVVTTSRANRMVSSLPDSASDIYAPGWDSSRSRDDVGSFLTSSGLGSPFPEDAKLCAAIGSFWPAVAPDNGRTFGNDDKIRINLDNQLPMLDEELGFHPNHERVRSGEVTSYRGWDGEYGPFFEKVGGQAQVNYVTIDTSDYVSHALAGRIRTALTAEIQSEELIARNQALEACQQFVNTKLCLVVFRKIDDWPTFGAGRPELVGGGYLLEFAELTGTRKRSSEIPRIRRRVVRRHICQVGSNGIALRRGGAAFVFERF